VNTADIRDTSPGDVSPPMLLVDFPPKTGLKEVSLSPRDIAARSAVAIDNAMASIGEMAERVASTTGQLVHQPREVEVEFGLKLDATGGTFLARAGAEAHLVVKLRWQSTDG
jgi:hypothetical protein